MRQLIKRAEGWAKRYERTKKRLQGSDVKTLTEALRIPDDAAATAARQLLEARRPREVVPALIPVLRDGNPEAREHAAYVLGMIGNQKMAKDLVPQAVPALVELVAGRLPLAVNALGALVSIDPRHPAVVPALVRRSREKNQLVSWLVEYLWEMIGPLNEAASPALDELSGDLDPAVQKVARKVKRRMHAKKRYIASRTPSLLKALDDPSEEIRHDAIWKLSHLAQYTRAALPGLVKALKDPDDLNRTVAMIGLGAMGPEGRDAVPGLVEALNDPDPSTRESAAECLGKIGAPGAARALREALNDPEADVRKAATEAIEEIDAL